MFPVANDVDHWRDLVFLNPIPNPLALTRAARTAWSVLRHPVKSREFPAKQERLVTADELIRYGLFS
ncbi:MAG: hypothetical protein ACR2JM_13375 [Mycobacterium sp.]